VILAWLRRPRHPEEAGALAALDRDTPSAPDQATPTR